MTKIFLKVCFGLLFLLLRVASVMAQRDQIFVGTRSLSMGGAFLAVADDGNAIAWNPAGLARLERIQASFAHANLFGIGIKSYDVSFLSRFYFIPPLTDYLSFGVDWFALDAGDNELTFHRNQFNFALAFKPPMRSRWWRRFSFGLNLKYLQMTGRLGERTALDIRGAGWDFGLLYHVEKFYFVPGRFNFGLMIHDAGGTRAKHDTDIRETLQHQNLRLGLSYRPFENWPGEKIPISDPVLALDFDERAHFGLEFWLARTLAFRAGLQKDFHTREPATLSFGLGLKTNLKNWPEAGFDYALTDSPVLPNTDRQFGGSIIFKENPRLIRIEKAQMNDVFASLYRHYALPGAEVGSLKLKNVSEETLKVWIALQAGPLLESQQADTVIMAPAATMDFPIKAVFKPKIIAAPAGRFSAEVKAAYIHKKNVYVSAAPVNFTLHGKNFLTWDDPGKAAAFVTYDDPPVKAFADAVLQKKIPGTLTPWFDRYNLAAALLIFDALQAYGFTYRPDPVTPFPSFADTLRGALYRLDQIQYPAEFLNSTARFGDCDDLTVLYASLLQQIGLNTALVSGPGHIFMMFDTDIPESESRGLPVPLNYFVRRNGTLWIPVEATLIPSANFTEAWTFAANRLNRAADAAAWKIYEVAANQAKYPPPPNLMPIAAGLKKPVTNFSHVVQKDSTALETAAAQYLKTFVDSLNLNLPAAEEIRLRNYYGAILGQNDDYRGAQSQFRQILAQNSSFAPAWHNWGNVEFVLGNFAKAESLYAKALAFNPYSRGTYLNLALLYQMMIGGPAKDSVYYQQKSEAALLKAAQFLEGEIGSAFAILGFSEERTDGMAESYVEKIKRRIKKVKEYIDTGFKKYVQKREFKGVALDRHGVKGRGEIDAERGELLAWSY